MDKSFILDKIAKIKRKQFSSSQSQMEDMIGVRETIYILDMKY